MEQNKGFRKILKKKRILIFMVLVTGMIFPSTGAILDPNEEGFDGQSLQDNYDSLVDALYQGDAVAIIGDKLWVPWFSTSSSCEINDLHMGDACNSGQTIDFENNCMVSDEFSQVGVIISMGKNQERMDQYVNTLMAIPSSFGKIPSWRIYREGNDIQPCRQGVNGNCDTASDSTARVIISLYNAGTNEYFEDTDKKQEYLDLAKELTEDFVKYEVYNECKESSFGTNICYWLASGSHSKTSGMNSNNFAYTGYFSDAIIAMLQSCEQTGNNTYCEIADDFTLNFLQASKYNGEDFSTPPGMSFKWTNLDGIPEAECTNSCSPVQWDFADASRAVGICQANYYADLIEHELPYLEEYCNKWEEKHMGSTDSIPIQYHPNGEAVNYHSGYFASGLQSLFFAGQNQDKMKESLNKSLSHYSIPTKTWDWTSCFGVYTQTFPMRALGSGIGRDAASFSNSCGDGENNNSNDSHEGEVQCEYEISQSEYSCNYEGEECELISDLTSGDCRTIISGTPHGEIKILTCKKSDTNVEVYRQDYPPGVDFNACLQEACLTQLIGFDSFNPNNFCSEEENTINNMVFEVEPSGALIGDYMEGTMCRKVQYQLYIGWIEAKVCKKAEPDYYEMYLLSEPISANICVEGNCVGESSGFVAFNY